MGVPSSRTPVRVARGTYANLSTTNALAALQEGEICFATDEGKLYVKQGASLNGISASSQAQPVPGDVTASPAFAGGTGTQADPYVITGGTSPFAGGTLESAQEITIANGTAGDIVLFTDQSVVASGDRFANQDVGTINSAGNYTFKLNYTDTPNTTTNNTTYNGVLQVGNVWFSWTVVQSDLAPLSEATATTIAYSGLAVGNTITATAGTAAGGTSPYTYAVRWQRSFNGTSGWFDTGSTGTTYTIVQADAGYYVRAVATATDSTPGASGGPLTVDLASIATTQINVNSLADITDVVLSEADPTGARFTSKDFNVAATMNPEGVPTSSKSVKVKFSGTFVDYPATDNVTTITDTDPADAAVTAATMPTINTNEYTNGQGGQLLRTNAVYNSSYYWDEQNTFMYFPDNTWRIVQWQAGSSSTYQQPPAMHNYNGYLGPILPTSRESTQTFHFQYMYPINGTSQYYLGYSYGGSSGTTQNCPFRGWVRNANGQTVGSIIKAYGSRMVYFPYASNTSNPNGYEINNTFSGHAGGEAEGNCLTGLPGWVGIQKNQSYIRYNQNNMNKIRWFQNLDVLNTSLNGWQLDNSNTYTDLDTDQLLPWNQLAAPGSAYVYYGADSGYSTTGKYTVMWLVNDGTTYSGWFTGTIDYDADPTVLANWTTRYTSIASISSNQVTYGPNQSHFLSVLPDGKIAAVWARDTKLHWVLSEDYGATWTYNQISLTSVKTNVDFRYDFGNNPYYYDGHWFIMGRVRETTSAASWDAVLASNNNGQSWNEVAAVNYQSTTYPRLNYSNNNYLQRSPQTYVPFLGQNGRLYMSTIVNTNHREMCTYIIDYKTELALAGGTNLSNNLIRLGDTLRQGTTSGKVINIDTGTNTITVDNVDAGSFSTGSPLQNTISHAGGTAGTMYGVVGGSGAVSDLQTSDPGFYSMGSNPNMTLTMPATFPTGNAPDVELPAGTTMQVTVQATNSSGSDTLDSNIITPT